MDLMDYRRKIIANSPHLMSASGAVVSFADGADLPLKSLIVDIEPVQSGTGDPSPVNFRPISGWNAVNVKNGNTVIATISLGQTVYGATINPLTGVLTVDRAMVDLGTLTWNTSSSGTNRFYSSNNGTPIYDKNNGVGTICSQYKYDGFGYPATSYYGESGTLRLLGSANSQTREIYIVDDAKAGKTGAQFKADMSGVQLVYKLATPYEIQLTPHQIRSLYGNNTIFADTGNTSLEYWAHP